MSDLKETTYLVGSMFLGIQTNKKGCATVTVKNAIELKDLETHTAALSKMLKTVLLHLIHSALHNFP